MGAKIDYALFITELQKRLDKYFEINKNDIYCQKGCSFCCEKGDYPLSDIELEYLMQGYISLDSPTKKEIQKNIKNIIRGGKCPFLINKKCSVYNYRPIICRVHGLAYLFRDNIVKLPHCTTEGKNYSSKFKKGEFVGKPVLENLETAQLLKDFNPIIKNLYDWIYLNQD